MSSEEHTIDKFILLNSSDIIKYLSDIIDIVDITSLGYFDNLQHNYQCNFVDLIISNITIKSITS